MSRGRAWAPTIGSIWQPNERQATHQTHHGSPCWGKANIHDEHRYSPSTCCCACPIICHIVKLFIIINRRFATNMWASKSRQSARFFGRLLDRELFWSYPSPIADSYFLKLSDSHGMLLYCTVLSTQYDVLVRIRCTVRIHDESIYHIFMNMLTARRDAYDQQHLELLELHRVCWNKPQELPVELALLAT